MKVREILLEARPEGDLGASPTKSLHRGYVEFGKRAAAAFVLWAALTGAAQAQQANVVAHEWGTFTSIAGNTGTAVQWYPWAVPSDLPDFVEHFQSANFKPSLSGTIRMETPVLYFYTTQETTVSVHVTFSKGLITEWYPHATGSAANTTNLLNAALKEGQDSGSVTWDRVMLRPSDNVLLLREQRDSRYYAARLANSTPLSVHTAKETQNEKFLFYRGVSLEESPVSAKVLTNGTVEIANRMHEPVAKLFWFERRGNATGIRSMEKLEERTELQSPDLNGTSEMADGELLSALMDEGLYPDEARAMLETWRDSWFEEGSRLLYIVPKTFVNRVLPLTISPRPAQTTRVFVGRLELVTPKTQATIETALAAHDERTLAKYNRFLQPILEILLQRESEPRKVEMIRQRLSQPYASVPPREIAAIATRK